jgi:hypothetical protein
MPKVPNNKPKKIGANQPYSFRRSSSSAVKEPKDNANRKAANQPLLILSPAIRNSSLFCILQDGLLPGHDSFTHLITNSKHSIAAVATVAKNAGIAFHCLLLPSIGSESRH